jgi:beta-glucosidase
MGDFPPGKRDIGAAFRVMHNLVLGHARAYHASHELQPAARVGIAHHYRGFIPHRSWLPLDGFAAGMQDRFFNDFFARAAATGVLRYPAWTQRLPQAKGTQDFFDHVSFNLLYASNMFGRRFYRADAELSATGFLANEPEGIFRALQWARGYQLPILITENGVEDPDDSLRPRYLIEHLHQVWRAINFNYPIKAYYHWSLVDNFEWERGWSQRFGLWEVDPETQARRKRPSADLYAEICDSNSLSSDMVARYAPSLIEKLFPD